MWSVIGTRMMKYRDKEQDKKSSGIETANGHSAFAMNSVPVRLNYLRTGDGCFCYC